MYVKGILFCIAFPGCTRFGQRSYCVQSGWRETVARSDMSVSRFYKLEHGAIRVVFSEIERINPYVASLKRELSHRLETVVCSVHRFRSSCKQVEECDDRQIGSFELVTDKIIIKRIPIIAAVLHTPL